MTFVPVKNLKSIQELGKHIRKLRKAKGYSHQRLADEADIAKSTVIKIEQAQINISVDIIFSLAKALEIDPQVLFQFK